MRHIAVLGLVALMAAACKDAAGPKDTISTKRGLTADLLGTPAVSIVDALGSATPTTQFSVFGSGGAGVSGEQFSGPEFILTERTTITEIGGFLNDCKSIVAGIAQCPGTLPFIVQIRPSTNGVPDASTVLASFPLSHDNDPLVISYESVAIKLTLGPGSYFALFAPQGSDEGSLLDNASVPFSYKAESITMGFFNPATGASSTQANQGSAVRILGSAALAGPSATLVAAPDLDARFPTPTVIEGTSIKLALKNSAPVGGTFQYAFDCGSGYTRFTTKSTAACPTVDTEQRTVRGQIRDAGGTTEYTAVVSVVNQKPHVVLTTTQGATSAIGSPRVATGSFTDPGVQDAPWFYSVDWGDGSSSTGTTITQAGPIPVSHAYRRVGTFRIRMKVTDKHGGTGKSNSVSVQVVP